MSGLGLGWSGFRAHHKGMRILICILMVLGLAACSSSGGGGGSNSYKTEANLLVADPTVIQLAVRDPLPVARMVLIDPSGVETAAYDIQRDSSTYQSNGGGVQPSVGVGVFGGSGWGGHSHSHVGSGIGIGIPLFSSGSSGYSGTMVESLAQVRIPNPVLYKTTWQSWKLRAELDDGHGNNRIIEMVPPKPL